MCGHNFVSHYVLLLVVINVNCILEKYSCSRKHGGIEEIWFGNESLYRWRYMYNYSSLALSVSDTIMGKFLPNDSNES